MNSHIDFVGFCISLYVSILYYLIISSGLCLQVTTSVPDMGMSDHSPFLCLFEWIFSSLWIDFFKWWHFDVSPLFNEDQCNVHGLLLFNIIQMFFFLWKKKVWGSWPNNSATVFVIKKPKELFLMVFVIKKSKELFLIWFFGIFSVWI